MSDKIPTGGRVVIGPDGASQWQRFYDPPLSRAENDAVKWFTELSPNEQLREVRRMKWNLEEATRTAEAFRRIVRRQDDEIASLRIDLAQHTPEGFVFPRAATDLLDTAITNGWKTAKAWTVDDSDENRARLEVHLRGSGWTFKLAWSADKGGGARMIRRGLAQGPRKPWHDAPSLRTIKKIIEES